MSPDFAGRTDVGRARRRNEDALLQRPDRGLFAVADGMGGHAGGDIASRIALDVLDEQTTQPAVDVAEQMQTAVHSAHAAILRAAGADSALAGMGTTLTALRLLHDGGCLIVHVGDSRAYRMRSDSLEQITRDQTWVQRQVDAGLLSDSEARRHPYSSVLTGALGIEDVNLEIQILSPSCQPGDVFLLCSDGLSGQVDDGEILGILASHHDLDAAAEALVAAANDAGGPDNITVILVRIR
jgi:PPM family protein phosphatase